MYSVNDILSLLEKGEKPETIAQNFTDILNAAIDQKKKDDEKAAKKKAEEEAKQKLQETKKRELQTILDEIQMWFNTYYPELRIQSSLKAEEVMPIFDDTAGSLKEFNKLFAKVPIEKQKDTEKAVDADKAINDFLKMFYLL